MEKDDVVAGVIVGALSLVCIGFIGVDLKTGFVDAKGFFSPFVMCVHVVKGGLEEGCVGAFLVKHDDASTANFADLDFFALRGIMGVGLGWGVSSFAFSAAPVSWLDRAAMGRAFGGGRGFGL